MGPEAQGGENDWLGHLLENGIKHRAMDELIDRLTHLRRLVHHNTVEAHRCHLRVSLSAQSVTFFNERRAEFLACTPRQVHPITQPVPAAAAAAAAAPFIRSMTSTIGPVITCSSIAECTLSLRPTLCTGTHRRLMARSMLSTAACVCAVTRMVLPWGQRHDCLCCRRRPTDLHVELPHDTRHCARFARARHALHLKRQVRTDLLQ